MSNSSPTLEQVADFLTGQLSEESAAEFARAIERDPTLKTEVLALKRKWGYRYDLTTSHNTSTDTEAAWASVSARIARPDDTGECSNIQPTPYAPNRFQRISTWLPAAVSVAALLLVFIGWTLGTNTVLTGLSTQASTYSTNYGQQAAILLADGSRVVLNVGSELQVPADYAAGNRTLKLIGEAMFTVENNTKTPFTVVTENRSVRVLGTKFIVSRYPTDTGTLVAVRSGKVAIDTTVLAEMQQATFSDSYRSEITTTTDSKFTFESGVLTLEDAPLYSAIAQLSRWYNAEIEVKDPAILNVHLNGAYAVGSIGDLAEILELTLNVNVERRGRKLTLHSR